MIQRTSKFLMANLGAEMERFFYWKEKNDPQMLAAAYDRARKIIEQIAKCPDMATRAQEIKILDDVINDLASKTPKLNILPSYIHSYFAPFVNNAVKTI